MNAKRNSSEIPNKYPVETLKENPIEIFCNLIDNKTIKFVGSVNSTISDIKIFVENKSNIPKEMQTITWAGKILENSSPLKFYNIHNHSTFFYLLKVSRRHEKSSSEHTWRKILSAIYDNPQAPSPLILGEISEEIQDLPEQEYIQLKIISQNINGKHKTRLDEITREATQKGADIILIQETKIKKEEEPKIVFLEIAKKYNIFMENLNKVEREEKRNSNIPTNGNIRAPHENIRGSEGISSQQ